MARVPSPRRELTVGVVTGAHGIRGAVKVRLHDEDPSILRASLPVVFVNEDAGERIECVVTRVSPVPGKPVARLFTDAIETRERAEALRGHELRVERDDLPALADDEFYLADVVGLVVVGRVGSGGHRELGTVLGVTSNGEQDLLEVSRAGGGTWLIPVVPGFVESISDVVRVDLPEGMGPEDAT